MASNPNVTPPNTYYRESTVNITGPAPGWHNKDFEVEYETLVATECELHTNGVLQDDTIDCGLAKSAIVQVPEWCGAEGLNACEVKIVGKNGLAEAEDSESYHIDLTAPDITKFEATAGTTTVDIASHPLITSAGSVTLNWDANDGPVGSGIRRYEVWRSPDGVSDWKEIYSSPTKLTHTDSPGSGDWWYGLRAVDKADNDDDENCITESAVHCGGVDDDDITHVVRGPIQVIFDNIDPVVTFVSPTPAAGTVISEDFTITYDATDNLSVPPDDLTCELFISVDGGDSWTKEEDASCGTGQTKLIEHAWCSTKGADKCGVQIRATDAADNEGSNELLYTFNQPPEIFMMLPVLSHPVAEPLKLTPTADDDKFIDDPPSYEWKVIEGDAGAVTFDSTAILQPTVDFTALGDFTFELTVDDGFFRPSATVKVTVIHTKPTADAGKDQTINFGLPSKSVGLDGTGSSDDGFLEPLTYEWKSLDDPDSVSFDDEKSPTPTLTFTASGEYDIMLRVWDGAFEDTDNVKITMVNARPKVEAGDNQELAFPDIASLVGTVEDDNLPNPPDKLTYLWTKEKGPGEVKFGSKTALSTTADFTLSGTYILRLTADDQELKGFADVKIIFDPPPDYALVPCGVRINDPDTPWDETADCNIGHTLLLVRNVLNFTLWKLLPLLIPIFAAVTGAVYYFSLGSTSTLVLVKRIWRAVILGFVIILLSWLFLNFLLGTLGFDIDVFGRWTEIEVPVP